MPNKYSYIDPEYVYTDPRTGVLRNLAAVTDHDTLTLVETGATSKRSRELRKHPLPIINSATLFDIHKYLFQDVYQWAGQPRTVEISKGGTPFFPRGRFSHALAFIDTLILKYRDIDSGNKSQLARQLAEMLDSINHLHPFREGNGRTQREFLRLLALEKGFCLDLNPPDNIDIYNRYMSGTINGDIDILQALIMELISSL